LHQKYSPRQVSPSVASVNPDLQMQVFTGGVPSNTHAYEQFFWD